MQNGENSLHEAKERLEARKCPVCGEPTRMYFFSGTYMPLEVQALKIVPLFLEQNFYPFTNLSENEQFLIHFSSVCNKCGFISQWMCKDEEIKFLRSEDGIACGFNIAWIYEPEKWKHLYENVTEINVKGYIKYVCDYIERIYGDPNHDK